MKVLWLSRHAPIKSQIDELRRLFGEYELLQDVHPFSDVADVERRMRDNDIDELVFVGPLTVLRSLCQHGINPLQAVMEPTTEDKAELKYNGKYLRFVEFRRVLGVNVKTEPICA